MDKQYAPPDNDPDLDPEVGTDPVILHADDPVQKDEEEA